tara:strand:+ start:703 stop:1599 length:897 start_codon:yes stop_codon:yes gene_type:complete
MGYKKPKETTRSYLENAPLPNHGSSYTVVSHKSVIDNTLTLLEDNGFTIKKEIYRANVNANVAQGIYHIYPTQTTDAEIISESELGMMFAWTNSYDKSTRFQCAVGAYVMVCYNGMVAGDMMNFKRKHTGSADYDVRVHLTDQIKNAEKYYKRILQDKEALKAIKLSCHQQSELAGRLFIEEDLLDSQQMSCIKSEISKPTHNYGEDANNAWTFYNHVTYALKKAHPRDWLQDTQNFHDFMTVECLNNAALNPHNLKGYELNFSNEMIEVNMADTDLAIEIDEDITHSRLAQDIFMGR